MRQEKLEIRKYLDHLQGAEVTGIYTDDDQKRTIEIVYINDNQQHSMTISANFVAGSMGFLTWFELGEGSLHEKKIPFEPMQNLKKIKSLSLHCDVVGEHQLLTIAGEGNVEEIFELGISGAVLEDEGDVITVFSRRSHYVHPLKTPQFDVELYKSTLPLLWKHMEIKKPLMSSLMHIIY